MVLYPAEKGIILSSPPSPQIKRSLSKDEVQSFSWKTELEHVHSMICIKFPTTYFAFH